MAKRDNEDELLSFALKTTAARVEERCRELRCGTDASTDDAGRAHARRNLRMSRDPSRGTMTITVEVPLESGELIGKALDRARDETTASHPQFAEESWSAQQACGYRPEDMTDDEVGTVGAYFDDPSAEGWTVREPFAGMYVANEPSAEVWAVRDPSAEGWTGEYRNSSADQLSRRYPQVWSLSWSSNQRSPMSLR